jgi:hypothetical protein
LSHQQGLETTIHCHNITLNFSPTTILLKWASEKFFELRVVFIFPMSIGDMLGRRVQGDILDAIRHLIV